MVEALLLVPDPAALGIQNDRQPKFADLQCPVRRVPEAQRPEKGPNPWEMSTTFQFATWLHTVRSIL